MLGPDVELADNVVLHSHIVVDGRTRIGTGTRVSPFASLGHPPQNLQYRGEPSELVIGADNIIGEYVTINPGTEDGGMVTRVGDGCMLMVGAHVGHDCQVGNRVVMANNATLGGHVTVGDGAMIGGLAAVHQYVRIGQRMITIPYAGLPSLVLGRPVQPELLQRDCTPDQLAAAVDRLLSNPAARAAQLANCRAAVSLLKPGPEPAALLAAREVLAEIARR